VISATDKNPKLSEAGIIRASKWAKFFQDVELDEIYSTNYQRTKSTATPTAESKNLVVKYYAPKDLLSDQFKESTKGKTVLVVGHSNTIPFLANFLIQEEKYPELDESEYSWLYKISIDANGKAISEARKIK
ncbi:MAG TPA: phosphoglycerate mutase family protein, partial [Aequorivita sp.]|nr:phosphoglycerate mutase family protein [Aequorivita sp.]